MGLDQVHGLTQHTQKRIIEERPFNSLNDFLTRVDPRKAEIENLIQCGGLDGLGSIRSMLENIQSGSWKKDQFSLFDWQESSQSDDWSLVERSQAQEQILGISVDVHPLELVSRQINAYDVVPSSEIESYLGKSIIVAGLKVSSHRARTVKGELMLFVSLEDLDGMIEVVFFPNLYQQNRQILRSSGPFLIRGVVEVGGDENDELWLRAEKVKQLRTE
jgi:DNA polymerase-3 subunit alpha